MTLAGVWLGLPYTPRPCLSTQMLLKSVPIPHPQHPVVLCPPTSVASLLTRDRIFAALSPACTAPVVAVITLSVSATRCAHCPHVRSALGVPTEWALTLHLEALAG